MDKAAQKRKQRELKKQAERKEAARLMSTFRLRDENLTFLVNADWKETGLARVQGCVKRPDGLLDMVYFRVFLDVEGLSLVQHMEQRSAADWVESVKGGNADSQLVPIPVAEAKAIVAGGARFAWEVGLRLPAGWEKACHLIGGIGAWRSADVSLFQKAFKGHPADIIKRLETGTIDDWIEQHQIDYLESQLADDDIEELQSRIKPVIKESLQRLEDILRKVGQQPHPLLETALTLKLISTMSSATLSTPERETLSADERKRIALAEANETLEGYLAARPADDQQQLRAALAQLDLISKDPELFAQSQKEDSDEDEDEDDDESAQP
jgi:hypothetical protein